MAGLLRRVLGALLALFALLEAYALGAAARLDGDLPPGLGNHPAVLARLGTRAATAPAGPPGTYRFAVIGDLQSSDVGERLLARLKGEPIDFLVLDGDLVNSGEREYHHLLAERMGTLAPFPFPILVAMGNRDLKAGSFELPDWEARYGPSNLWFSHRGDLFVVLRLADPYWPQEASIAFLEAVLAEQRSRHRRAFVFSHVPPAPHRPEARLADYAPDPEDLVGSSLLPQHDQVVRAACAAHRVDAYFSGHMHGYWERRAGPTAYFVSGGGGAGLDGQGGNFFHHALVVEVGPEGQTTRFLVDPGGWSLGTSLRRFSACEVAPWLRSLPWPFWAAQLALAAALWGWRDRRA